MKETQNRTETNWGAGGWPGKAKPSASPWRSWRQGLGTGVWMKAWARVGSQLFLPSVPSLPSPLKARGWVWGQHWGTWHDGEGQCIKTCIAGLLGGTGNPWEPTTFTTQAYFHSFWHTVRNYPMDRTWGASPLKKLIQRGKMTQGYWQQEGPPQNCCSQFTSRRPPSTSLPQHTWVPTNCKETPPLIHIRRGLGHRVTWGKEGSKQTSRKQHPRGNRTPGKIRMHSKTILCAHEFKIRWQTENPNSNKLTFKKKKNLSEMQPKTYGKLEREKKKKRQENKNKTVHMFHHLNRKTWNCNCSLLILWRKGITEIPQDSRQGAEHWASPERTQHHTWK